MALLRPSIALKNGVKKLDGFLLAAKLAAKGSILLHGFPVCLWSTTVSPAGCWRGSSVVAAIQRIYLC